LRADAEAALLAGAKAETKMQDKYQVMYYNEMKCFEVEQNK
jgi:hypothetical protein